MIVQRFFACYAFAFNGSASVGGDADSVTKPIEQAVEEFHMDWSRSEIISAKPVSVSKSRGQGLAR